MKHCKLHTEVFKHGGGVQKKWIRGSDGEEGGRTDAGNQMLKPGPGGEAKLSRTEHGERRYR